MKKYIRTDSLSPEVIQSLKEQGVNLEGREKGYEEVAVDEVNTPGYYREDEEGNLFFLKPKEGKEIKVKAQKVQ